MIGRMSAHAAGSSLEFDEFPGKTVEGQLEIEGVACSVERHSRNAEQRRDIPD